MRAPGFGDSTERRWISASDTMPRRFLQLLACMCNGAEFRDIRHTVAPWQAVWVYFWIGGRCNVFGGRNSSFFREWGSKLRTVPIRSGLIKLTPPPLEPHCWRSVCSLFQVVLFALLSLIFGCISEIIRFYNPFVEKLSTSLARNALLADCRCRQNNGDAFVMAVVVERPWTSSTTLQ